MLRMENVAKTKIADCTAMEIADVEENNGHSGYFIVAFVDLLGTDARNTEIKAQTEFPAAMLEQEVAKVKTFQRNFYRIFKAIVENNKWRKSLRPENLLLDFDRLKGNEVTSYVFSDAIIFHASLNTQQGRLVPTESIFSILVALAFTQLWALSRGQPFRGGVEIGRAALFHGNQILGPALSDAVKLEKQAQFPRIIVGEGARKYLELNTQPSTNTQESHANQTYAELCARFLCESNERNQLCKPDNTDETMSTILSVDVHADLVVELIGGSQQHQELIANARKFAESEIQRFTNSQERDEKLACRYRLLLDYLKGERAE